MNDTILYTISIDWVDVSGMSFLHTTGVWSTPEKAASDVESTVKDYMKLKVSQGWKPVGEPTVEYYPSKGSIISGTAW